MVTVSKSQKSEKDLLLHSLVTCTKRRQPNSFGKLLEREIIKTTVHAHKQSSFFISLIELDEFSKIKLSKIGRLAQESGMLTIILKFLLCLCETVNESSFVHE